MSACIGPPPMCGETGLGQAFTESFLRAAKLHLLGPRNLLFAMLPKRTYVPYSVAMDVGKVIETVIVEPIHSPVPSDVPAPPPPVREPEREPAGV